MEVAIKASAIPDATTVKLVVWAETMPAKGVMIPHTVLNNLIKGAIASIVAKNPVPLLR